MNKALQGLYSYKDRDITMTVIIIVREIIDIIKDGQNITFIEATNRFYGSETSKILQDTETTLWSDPHTML